MRLSLRHSQKGLAVIPAVVAVAILTLILFMVLSAIAYFQGPSSITLTEVSRSPRGGTAVDIVFELTFNYATAGTAAITLDEEVEEDDYIIPDNVLETGVRLTIPAGATSGSRRFRLTCEVDSCFWMTLTDLSGNNGTSDCESEHEIHVEYQRYLLPNVTSDNLKVSCLPPPAEEQQQ